LFAVSEKGYSKLKDSHHHVKDKFGHNKHQKKQSIEIACISADSSSISTKKAKSCSTSWTAKWLNKREASFGMAFDNPIHLSQNEEPDKLVIIFWNMSLWTGAGSKRRLQS